MPANRLRTLAAAIRGRIEVLFGDRLLFDGFIPLGCDGTQLECPRSEELERRLGTFGKKGSGEKSSAPMIWNTSIMHLTLGIPWCWWWGKGKKASERAHLLQMLPVMCSPRKVLLEIRRDINGRSPKGESFAERIAKAERERRTRQTPKEKRQWPRRKTHKPPKQPIILRMTSELKAEVEQNLQAA